MDNLRGKDYLFRVPKSPVKSYEGPEFGIMSWLQIGIPKKITCKTVTDEHFGKYCRCGCGGAAN